MKQQNENSAEDYLGNIADELGTISGLCSEIKETQLSAATAEDFKEYAAKMENILQEGVLPAVKEVRKLIQSPPNYTINMKTDGLSKEIVKGLSDVVKEDLYKNVDKVIKSGIDGTFNQAVNYLKTAVDDMRRNVNRMTDGHWWLVIPNWAKLTFGIFFGILLAASIGFSIGFFNEQSDNEKFRKMEWLYRFERVSYDQEGIRNAMLREEAMMAGTKEEQDSIKRMVINLERKKHAERTHTYFRPSDDWTPEKSTNSIW